MSWLASQSTAQKTRTRSHTDCSVSGKGETKEEEEMSISKLCLPPQISQPYSLLTSLPKRDDLIQSTQTSNRFLQLKHIFT